MIDGACTAALAVRGPMRLVGATTPAPAQTRDDKPATTNAATLKPKGKLRLLGAEVPPGTSKRLTWTSGTAMEGFVVPVPVIVLNGKGPGPVLCLTAAVHGDELNGIEVVRRVLDDIDVEELNGAVIGVPIVNIQGFYRGTRYLPDRRDLNRYFPGNPRGSAATRIAHSFFTEVVRHCSALDRPAHRLAQSDEPAAGPCRSASAASGAHDASLRRDRRSAQRRRSRLVATCSKRSRHSVGHIRDGRAHARAAGAGRARREGGRNAAVLARHDQASAATGAIRSPCTTHRNGCASITAAFCFRMSRSANASAKASCSVSSPIRFRTSNTASTHRSADACSAWR